MPFALASPWLLFALTAIAVPVLVHLVRRRERGGHAFPSLMFIQRMSFQARRRRTLRDPLLLALRCLALALLVLAFTGPELARTPVVSADSGPVRATALLLDRSYSMSPAARWEAAVTEAERQIDALADGERMAVVAFDETATLVVPLTDDRTALRAAVSELEPSAGGTRLAAAVTLGERILRESGASEPAMVLVSDLQRSVLARLDRLYLDAATAFDTRPVTTPVTANAAVVSAAMVPDGEDGGASDTLAVQIRNTGTAALTGVEVTLETDGRSTARRRIDLAPGAERTVRLPVTAAADRQIPARVVLGADDLAADNVHHLVITPDPPLRVALATGVEPGPDGEDPAVYLERALAVATEPAMTVTAWPGDDPTAGIDVLVADDAALRDAGTRQRVTRFVEGGGALLLMMADTAATDRSPASASPAVPALGALRRHPLPGAGVTLDAAFPADSRETPGESEIIADALAGARFQLSRDTAATAGGNGSRVLGRLETGEPWLVEHTHGRGRSLVMTTGYAGPWGNLALEPGFVPLLHELVRHLARRPPVALAHTPGDVVDLRRLARRLPNGADWARYLADGGAAVVELPGGGRTELPPGEHLLRVREPGLHQVHRGDGAAPSLALAVNTDRRESLLTAASPAELRARITPRPAPAGQAPAVTREDVVQARTPLGWYLLIAALTLLFLESLAANRLSRRRRQHAAQPGTFSGERRAGATAATEESSRHSAEDRPQGRRTTTR